MNLVGRTLSHYEVLEQLGEGGMGTVYKARDLQLDRFVALKILATVQSEEFAARFEREAKAISALNHPNIATIYAYARDAGMQFLALEYISGGTLHSKLQGLKDKGQRLDPEAVVTYALQIGRGLAHAHARESSTATSRARTS